LQHGKVSYGFGRWHSNQRSGARHTPETGLCSTIYRARTTRRRFLVTGNHDKLNDAVADITGASYEKPPSPPLTGADAQWARALVKKVKTG